MSYHLKATLQITVETYLDDADEPTEKTLEFLIQQDLLDMGYGCDEIKTLKFEKRRRKR